MEHAYQAMKFPQSYWYLFTDPWLSAAKAKRLGSKQPLPESWFTNNIHLMEQLLRIKFQDPDLKEKSLETGNQPLVEGNYWGDVFWGVCKGEGRNHLGRLLMKIREDLK